MPASPDVFKKFPNNLFIETGTYIGDGVKAALAAGFPLVRSVELGEKLHAANLERFKTEPRVQLFHGTSESQLPAMIADIHTPITFWLDAHYSAGVTAKGPEMAPILKEIAIIAKHPVKTHTILIDDRRLFGKPDFDGTTEEEMKSAILALNPAYHFSYETGSHTDPIFKDDILVAKIP